MSGQIPTRTIKITTIMRSAAFVRGFKEARKGVPMDYDAFSGKNEIPNRWNYERGRQFGFVYASTLKEGARVKNDTVLAWVSAKGNKWIL